MGPNAGTNNGQQREARDAAAAIRAEAAEAAELLGRPAENGRDASTPPPPALEPTVIHQLPQVCAHDLLLTLFAAPASCAPLLSVSRLAARAHMHTQAHFHAPSTVSRCTCRLQHSPCAIGGRARSARRAVWGVRAGCGRAGWVRWRHRSQPLAVATDDTLPNPVETNSTTVSCRITVNRVLRV